jgi:hypothetical protein
MAFTYTALSAYVLDQLWGFQSSNALRQNIRYLAEDILSDPAVTGNKVDLLILDNGATDGGALYFSGGTTRYLKSDAAGAILEVGGQTFSLPSDKLIGGDRVMICYTAGFGGTNPLTSSFYGFRAGKPFSILSIGASGHTTSFTSSGNTRVDIVDASGTSIVTGPTLNFTANNQYKSGVVTQARGVDAFSSEFFQPKNFLLSGTYSGLMTGAMEIVYD